MASRRTAPRPEAGHAANPLLSIDRIMHLLREDDPSPQSPARPRSPPCLAPGPTLPGFPGPGTAPRGLYFGLDLDLKIDIPASHTEDVEFEELTRLITSRRRSSRSPEPDCFRLTEQKLAEQAEQLLLSFNSVYSHEDLQKDKLCAFSDRCTVSSTTRTCQAKDPAERSTLLKVLGEVHSSLQDKKHSKEELAALKATIGLLQQFVDDHASNYNSKHADKVIFGVQSSRQSSEELLSRKDSNYRSNHTGHFCPDSNRVNSFSFRKEDPPTKPQSLTRDFCLEDRHQAELHDSETSVCFELSSTAREHRIAEDHYYCSEDSGTEICIVQNDSLVETELARPWPTRNYALCSEPQDSYSSGQPVSHLEDFQLHDQSLASGCRASHHLFTVEEASLEDTKAKEADSFQLSLVADGARRPADTSHSKSDFFLRSVAEDRKENLFHGNRRPRLSPRNPNPDSSPDPEDRPLLAPQDRSELSPASAEEKLPFSFYCIDFQDKQSRRV